MRRAGEGRRRELWGRFLMDGTTPLILASGLTKTFVKDSQKIEVLRGIDLEIKKGETLAIIGTSGVGKSTLVHILGTLDRQTAGTVHYEGVDVFGLSERELVAFRNRAIGFVFQFHHLLPEFTATENVMMPCLIGRMDMKNAARRAKAALGELGLSHRLKHKPGELSGGEQQRVAIARALVVGPRIIFADEPTGNLDRRTGEGVEEILLKLNEKLNATLMVVTHNVNLANKMKRQLEIVDGKIIDRHGEALE